MKKLMVLKIEIKIVNDVEGIIPKKRKHVEILDNWDEGISDGFNNRGE